MTITINWLTGHDQWEHRNLTKRGGAIGFKSSLLEPSHQPFSSLLAISLLAYLLSCLFIRLVDCFSDSVSDTDSSQRVGKFPPKCIGEL